MCHFHNAWGGMLDEKDAVSALLSLAGWIKVVEPGRCRLGLHTERMALTYIYIYIYICLDTYFSRIYILSHDFATGTPSSRVSCVVVWRGGKV